MLTGTISVTGAHEFTAHFATHVVIEVGVQTTPAPYGSTCADYARGFLQQGGGTSFDAPVLHTPGSENVYLRASLRASYMGPGTYASQQTAGLAGQAIVQYGGAFDDFASTHGATALTVKRDGSGTLTFSDWRTSEVRGGLPGVEIAGAVDWVCQ